ncbi:hypothetical protein HPS36_01965 [Halorubrum salinarum]|uniref:Uncharacterized protein n=1 Tax=Halorubrum salinarum TaxID=2739057 RepID=A0A7D3XSU0_9EURY|nr:hypothetical protein [Halorubrum salinarum]QKG91669.1 hypothetical protein HPS36_01965 [Halorubrum salinarum]
MSENAHAGTVAEQLAMAEAEGEEPNVIEVPITLHRNDLGLHAWVDESAVGDEIANEIDVEEIERRLFNRLPEVLLQNAEERLEPEWSRREDAPRVAVAEYYPDIEQLGGVALSMEDRLQWAMIPRVDGGESA